MYTIKKPSNLTDMLLVMCKCHALNKIWSIILECKSFAESENNVRIFGGRVNSLTSFLLIESLVLMSLPVNLCLYIHLSILSNF